MEFDITHLDKNLVIQALFAHAAPVNLGKAEYLVRKIKGDNVDGLSDEECEEILYEYNQLDKGYVKLLDYHKGKPMKLHFQKKANGRILTDSGSYDVRNGKYRFLEAFLDTFTLDEIFITKKGYRPYIFSDLPDSLVRTKQQDEMFKFIIKNTVAKENEHGKYWGIDESKVKYTPPFML